MQQVILAVDDQGKFLEYIPREIGHTGKGRRHLAITVLLQNSKGQVLLQKRKHQIFDNIWDITGATHPLHKSDDTDESLEEATRRCLREEWGIGEIEEISEACPLGVREIGVFNYFAQYGELCENEHCFLMLAEHDGPIDLNKNTGYEYKWTDKSQFLKDIKSKAQNFTPWAIKSVEILKNTTFFSDR